MPALITGAGVLFTISLFFVVLLKRDFKKVEKGNAAAARRRQFLRKTLFTALWLSVSFSLASTMAVNQTTNGMAYLAQTEVLSVRITAGTALNVLQWLAFAASALFAAGISGIFIREGGTIQAAGSTKSAIHGNFPNITVSPPPPPPPPPQ